MEVVISFPSYFYTVSRNKLNIMSTSNLIILKLHNMVLEKVIYLKKHFFFVMIDKYPK